MTLRPKLSPTDQLVARARDWQDWLNSPKAQEFSAMTVAPMETHPEQHRENQQIVTVGNHPLPDLLYYMAKLLGELATDLETVNTKSKRTEQQVRRDILKELL